MAGILELHLHGELRLEGEGSMEFRHSGNTAYMHMVLSYRSGTHKLVQIFFCTCMNCEFNSSSDRSVLVLSVPFVVDFNRSRLLPCYNQFMISFCEYFVYSLILAVPVVNL
jgi:hypothetical protein